MQGVIISGGVLAYAIIRDSTPEQEAASQMSYVSMAMAVAPMLARISHQDDGPSLVL